MKLSAPLYALKNHARVLSRNEGIPLHQALDRVAQQEGYQTWSLLAAKAPTQEPLATLLEQVRPGELMLLSSRRGQGKTRLSLALAIHTLRRGGHAAFFTLDFTPGDVADCFKALGAELSEFGERLLLDDSDQICAGYILAKLAATPKNTLVIVDYLQLLDQRRETPELMQQVQQLRAFARERQVAILFLSQIDRRYDASSTPSASLRDIRLPNPLDLRLFDKLYFLHEGELQTMTPTA